MKISSVTKRNFATLKQAFANGDVALLSCTRNSDGADVVLLCMVNRETDGACSFAPVAELINGNPYEMYTPPEDDHA